MTGPTGSGVAVGLASSEAQVQQSGGLNVFTIFPKLLIPMAIYALVAYSDAFFGGEGASMLTNPLFTLGLPSGEWAVSASDLILTLALAMLFIEMVGSASSGTSSLLNHGLSMATLLVGILLFLLVPVFATSTFFLLIVMSLLDVVAGFTVTAISARRDLGAG